MSFRLPSAADVAAAKAKRRKTTNMFVEGEPAPASSGPSTTGAASSSLSAPSGVSTAASSFTSYAHAPPQMQQPPVPTPHAGAAGNGSGIGAAGHPTGPPPRTSATGASTQFATAAAAVNTIPSNAILVSKRQQGNPVLRAIRNVPWQFGDTSADYVLSDTTCALFLALRYHLLHPDYLTRRLRELSNAFTLRLVLLLVDTEDAERAVLEVTKTALLHDCTTVCAWSAAEAGRYLETLRAYAKKPADLIKERSDGAFLSQLGECLTSVRPLNKTDVATLHATFGSLAKMMHASQEDLALCPGLGERKVHRLRETFTAPFLPRGMRPAGMVQPHAAAPRPETAAPSAVANDGPGNSTTGMPSETVE